ncbi:MAG: MarR family winged helix-turn-helix transcriptional regulator [Phycisphaerales bacterium]
MPDLGREIGKKGKFASLEQETALNLQRAADRLEAPFDALFQEHGLSSAQYNALRIIRGAGPLGTPIQRIGEHMITRQPDMTRLVDRLEKAGFVERKRCDEDRRVIYATLTKDGKEILRKLDKPVLEIHQKQFAHMKKEQVEMLNALLYLARQAPD